MPLETALPPAQVDVQYYWTGPAVDVNQFATAGANRNALRFYPSIVPNLAAGIVYGTTGGTGSTLNVNDGGAATRQAWRATSTTAPLSGGWYLPLGHPAFGPASSFNPGAQLAPDSVVSVWRFHFRLSTALMSWTVADRVGFYFIPYRFTGSFNIDGPGGTQPGFGVFINDDGGGNAQLEYISYNAAVILERIVIGPAIVPDLTAWSTAQFVLVSAASGREAALRSLIVNSVEVLAGGREFGSAELARPDAVDPFALYYAPGQQAGFGAGAFIDFCVDGYAGRFAPDGTELQPFNA